MRDNIQTAVEHWRPVVDWENFYEVSQLGRVRRTARGASTRPGTILCPMSCGGHPGRRGYKQVTLCRPGFKKNIKLHRLVVEAFVGRLEPREQVDHINGNPSDCRVSNLRVVTGAQNAKNRRINQNNTAGAKGVHLHKRSQKYVARIQVDGKRLQLGEFTSLEAAAAAYRSAALLHFGPLAREACDAAA